MTGAITFDEDDLVERLRARDDSAFRELFARYHAQMVRVARTFVSGTAIAEDVAQETWLAVIRGIDAFEQRSSLRTWIFAILVNKARSRGTLDHRNAARELAATEPAVSSDRFVGPPGRGRWRAPLVPWHDDPEIRSASRLALETISDAIARLSPLRRQVLVLRDVEGWPAADVCAVLGITEANQRVLLHRARADLRSQLERSGMQP